MKTILTIKTEKSLKLSAQKLAEEIGVPLSTIVNSLMKQFVRDKEITFSASYKPSPYLEKIMLEVEEDTLHNKNISKGFSSVDTLMKELKK
jgi:addiction module RelB/DinJ family antitoxin